MNALDRTPWAASFPIDAATPMTSVHLGVEYRGEVVRAGRWSPELGLGPGDGYHFRIVLLQESPRNGLRRTVGQGAAVCVPASRPGREATRIIGEITAAKEAAYLTRRDVDAAAINSALRERQRDLEGRLVSEESARFSQGVICVHDGPGPDPSKIYAGGGPLQWVENLAGWLLARSYPSLPIDTHTLHDPVGEGDAETIFASIFDQPGADPELLERLAPALGLALPGSSGRYDPSGCRVFPLIRQKLADGPVPFAQVHHHLAHDVGLTGQLASLYLLLFIHHERPEHQVQLLDDAVMFMADDSRLLGSRLTPDLIPLLAWEPELTANAASIGPASAPSFSDARHHLSVLCPGLVSGGAEAGDMALTRSLESIRRDSETSRRVLDSLDSLDSITANRSTGPGAGDDTQVLKAALDRLSRIGGDGYAGIYHSLRAAYPSLSGLQDDLETLRQLTLLEDDSAEIFEAQIYIADAQVPAAGFPNLAVDRETLLTGLSPSRLVRSRGRGWSAISRDAAAFKIRYTLAYREHHRQFHDALPGFQSALQTAKKKMAALGLLNTIEELGPPTGDGLEKDLAALSPGPSPCPLPASSPGSSREKDLDLSKEPYCSECRITLEQSVPTAELARLAPQVDMALGGKTQELSRRLVEKALAGRADERWLEFLQIVQASELSSLANTLDLELVSFIRQVLD